MAVNPPYSPLPSSRSLRLLKVIECPEPDAHGNVTLECSLDTYSLDGHCPEYVALSYTWGPPFDYPEIEKQYGEDQARKIFISHDGRPLHEHQVGRNLYEALLQIHKTKWQSYIWVDALCINQGDTSERAPQVQLMGEIYSRPIFVLAWIGPEPPNVEEIKWWYGPFMEYLERYINEHPGFSSLLDALPRTSCRRDPDLGEEALHLHGSEINVPMSRVLALADWFDKTRYFNRVWVVQELALPSKVVYLLGHHDLSDDAEVGTPDWHTVLWSWQALNMETMRALVRANNTKLKLGLEIPPATAPPATQLVESLRSNITSPETLRKYREQLYGATSDDSNALALLELILARCTHLHATDSRDLIYGFLGMIAKCYPGAPDIVKVDYGILMQDLIKAVTVKLLKQLPYMTCSALRTPSSFPRLQGLPSWAIDPTTHARGAQPGGLSNYRMTPYNAFPARTQENISIEVEGNALLLYGLHCGNIKTCIQSWNENTTVPNFKHDFNRTIVRSMEFTRRCLELVGDMGTTYRWTGNQAIFDAVVQTITLSKDIDPAEGFPVGTAAFWLRIKRAAWLLRKAGRTEDAELAGRTRSLLEDCNSLMANLSNLGLPIPQDLLDYMRRLVTEDDPGTVYGDQATMEAEDKVLFQIVNSTTLINRLMFRTEDDLLGLAMDDTQPGDQLWILCRARVPHILRPLPDGTFVTLGEAYVHGGVDGELIENNIAGPLQKIKIV